MVSLGLEFEWGEKRLFLGIGIQHQMRRAMVEEIANAPSADRMETIATPGARRESTAVMLHLDAETPLPRSLVAP
jgi:hypothetical protein